MSVVSFFIMLPRNSISVASGFADDNCPVPVVSCPDVLVSCFLTPAIGHGVVISVMPPIEALSYAVMLRLLDG